MNNKHQEIINIESRIPMGILATSPDGEAIVKLGFQNYAIVNQKRKTVVFKKTPYNLIDHGMRYMKENNIVVSEAEKNAIMALINSKK